MTTMLERASHAVEDALASDNNHPDDIARAVLMVVREPDMKMIIATNLCDDISESFTAMIDAILNETHK